MEGEVMNTLAAVFCWMLPLAGLFFDPSGWWKYLIWLAVGTVIMALLPDGEPGEEDS
jgi:hypothetical protein